MTPTTTHNTLVATPVATSHEDLEWTHLWNLPDHSQPINFGVDQAIDADGTKYYRAYAFAGGGLEKTLHTPMYEACDSADVGNVVGYIPSTTHAHDKLVTDAAVARAGMQPHQKSPADMRVMSHDLQTQIRQDYADYLEQEEIKARQRVYDEDALKSARTLIRGLQLLLTHGSSEEKEAIKRIFHNNK